MMLHKEAWDIVRALDVLIIGEMVHDLPPGCNLKNSSPPNQVAPSGKDKWRAREEAAANSCHHSPLSCNSLADGVRTNLHCLFGTFNEAEAQLAARALTSLSKDRIDSGARGVFMNRTIRLFHHICSRDLAAVARRDPSGVARINCSRLLVSKGAGCMLARDFDGIAFGLRARLRLIERRARHGLGFVLRVFRFYGLHAGLRFLGRIGHS
jgi:hypothetical protein